MPLQRRPIRLLTDTDRDRVIAGMQSSRYGKV